MNTNEHSTIANRLPVPESRSRQEAVHNFFGRIFWEWTYLLRSKFVASFFSSCTLSLLGETELGRAPTEGWSGEHPNEG